MKHAVHLTPFRIANGAKSLAELPTRLKILNWGVNETVNGPVILNEHTAQVFASNHARIGLDRVALDFEHNTVPGTPEFARTREPRDVAAFGTPELIPGDGLYLVDIEYTPIGRTAALNFPDLSPAPKLSPGREVEWLHSVALTRAGAVAGLSFFAVEMDTEEPTQEERSIMDKIMAILRKALGLADDATEDDVMKGIGGLATLSAKLSDIEARLAPVFALVGDSGQVTVLSADLTALKGESAKTQALQGELDALRKEIVCYHARLEGKVVPLSAEEMGKTDLQTLRNMVERLEVTVPVGQVTPLHVAEPTAGAGGGNTPVESQVARMCGLDPAKLVK
jgi:hypothetical protein